ncbi:hypothetical protein GCM10020331_060260 [Ectobacillus funiculus]
MFNKYLQRQIWKYEDLRFFLKKGETQKKWLDEDSARGATWINNELKKPL